MKIFENKAITIGRARADLVILLLIFSFPLHVLSQSLAETPSLIPLPQSLRWTSGSFPLSLCKTIIINDRSLQNEARKLVANIKEDLPIKYSANENDQYSIQLKLGKVVSPYGQNEAYRLIVNDKTILLTANTPHGIFNGLQTLSQLISNRVVHGCNITDYPAYQWRGYMVDVGRNYQTPELLKQQIDVMSRYKLNIFHLHLTEHIAWRLQVKLYPQLTSPESMLRDQGKYYSIAEMKEMIKYCRDRYITLVPEIDMPGHSNAFTRAMGVNMQSDDGLHIIKNILREVCTTYDIPYIHIGADEVAIKNQNFLPEVTQLIHQYKKETIGWHPGGNYDDHTIRELWGRGGPLDNSVRYIDSRALYLSDMAPQSSVVSIFQRQLGGKLHGDSSLLGAEICLWDDLKMEKETDHLSMNAVYPDMIAFGERSWRGGGYPGIVLDIGPDSSERAKDFYEFEKRLIIHKRSYFRQLSFPYVQQSSIHWKLLGPFENGGDLSAAFWPELPGTASEDSSAAIQATGGTIWLWYHNGFSFHTWLPAPQENTTWYAFTRVWSDSDTTIGMWIGFQNLLRSIPSTTPPAGEWDYKKSKIWIDEKLISPPAWKYPGRSFRKNLEQPLVDEGYYYRPPVIVNLKKGWNRILVKLPLLMPKELAAWQRRCMFSMMPVHQEGGVNWYFNKIIFQPDNTTD